MKIHSLKYLTVLLMIIAIMRCDTSIAAGADSTVVLSPDGNLRFTFWINSTAGNTAYYKVGYKDNPVILASGMGLVANTNSRASSWQSGLSVTDVVKNSSNSLWKPVLGENAEIRNNFNEAKVTLTHVDLQKKGSMQIIIRAYNEGIAFRYFFPEDKATQILELGQEKTFFNIPAGAQAYFTERAQGKYTRQPIKDWKNDAELPLTITLASNLWISINQAEQVNYSRMRLKTEGSSLVSQLYGEVVETSPFATPWRIVMVAEKPGKLLENNFIIQNLNPPNKLESAHWVKPGTIMREVTLSTEGAKRMIDFAVEQDIKYLLFDAGWYNSEYLISSDATKVDVDPKYNRKNDLNLQEVLRYAKSRDKGVFLYVNHRALERNADTLFPLYKSWGVAGVKFGFVQTGSHLWNRWLHDAIKKAAQYNLLVNVHDEYMPSGFSRTYPNLLTQEGVLGNEAMPDATHNTMLPFTRFIAGSADYTFCFNNAKIKNTKCHQLALPVVYFSPLQTLYWYGKPEDYSDRTEIEFWKGLPTVWQETRVVDGMPGVFAAIARRYNQQWHLGVITNTESRQVEIPASFLEKGKKYLATIYEDDADGKVKKRSIQINSSSKLKFSLRASGGAAANIQPQ